MASKRNRQRKLERARVERRIARQAHQTRRKRQIQAGVGASLAVVLIVVGLTWLLGGFDNTPEPRPTIASGTCTWHLKDPSADSAITDTGHPPTTGEARTGSEILTIKTNLGEIQATIDLSRAPCTAASFAFLGQQKYYDGSRCHRLNTVATFLQCGDSTGTGVGQPSYTFDDEDLPSAPLAAPSPTAPPRALGSPSPSASPSASTSADATYYAKGTIVMANTGANTNSGQFYIIYGDASNLGPAYSIVGQVTKGLGLIEQAAKAGALNPEGKPAPDGKPNLEMIVEQLYLGASSSPSPSPSPSPAASPSASPSATGTP